METNRESSAETLWEKLVGIVFGSGASRVTEIRDASSDNPLPQDLVELTEMTTHRGEDSLEPGAQLVNLWTAWFGEIKDPGDE